MKNSGSGQRSHSGIVQSIIKRKLKNQVTMRERFVKGPDWINSFNNGKEKLRVLSSYNSDNKHTNKKEAESELDSVQHRKVQKVRRGKAVKGRCLKNSTSVKQRRWLRRKQKLQCASNTVTSHCKLRRGPHWNGRTNPNRCVLHPLTTGRRCLISRHAHCRDWFRIRNKTKVCGSY